MVARSKVSTPRSIHFSRQPCQQYLYETNYIEVKDDVATEIVPVIELNGSAAKRSLAVGKFP